MKRKRKGKMMNPKATDSFVQDTEETPVIFRVHRQPKTHGSDVVAVFPCEPFSAAGREMVCYAHVGQHGGCDFGWYRETRPAFPEEYADLKAELEAAPYGYRLKVYQRINSKLRARFDEGVRIIRDYKRDLGND